MKIWNLNSSWQIAVLNEEASGTVLGWEREWQIQAQCLQCRMALCNSHTIHSSSLSHFAKQTVIADWGFFPSLFLSDQHLFFSRWMPSLKRRGLKIKFNVQAWKMFPGCFSIGLFHPVSHTAIVESLFTGLWTVLNPQCWRALSKFKKNCILKSLLLSVSTPSLQPCLLIWLHSQPGCSSVQDGTSGMRWRSWE